MLICLNDFQHLKTLSCAKDKEWLIFWLEKLILTALFAKLTKEAIKIIAKTKDAKGATGVTGKRGDGISRFSLAKKVLGNLTTATWGRLAAIGLTCKSAKTGASFLVSLKHQAGWFKLIAPAS